jgi:hypothetical protein
MSRSPGDFFADAKEKQLAEIIWRMSDDAKYTAEWKYGQHAVLAYGLSLGKTRLWRARDWITYLRDGPGQGTVATNTFMKKEFGVDLGLTDDHMANVEHFYVAAAISALGGAAVPGGAQETVANGISTLYEMVVQPIGVVAWWTYNGEDVTLSRVGRFMAHNAQQLTGPDAAGAKFGGYYGSGQYVNDVVVQRIEAALAKSPERNPLPSLGLPPPSKVPTVTPPRLDRFWVVKGKDPKTGKHDTLSGISKRFYGVFDYWPVIFDANRDKVSDPNIIKPGWRLKVPFLDEISEAEKANARQRHKNWRPS